MPSTPTNALLLLALCFAGGAGAGHWLARQAATPAETPPAASAAAETLARSATATARIAATPAAAVTAPVAATAVALPPRDVPVAGYYDTLAAAATAGDAGAARRLADDLHECATLERQLDMAENLLERADRRGRRNESGAPPQRRDRSDGERGDRRDRRLQAAERMVERAVASEQRCAGLDPALEARSADWIRQAAAAGDREAQLCYALAPNEWNRDIMTPEWVDWSERWNAEAPGYVRQAFEAGLPEAAAVLAGMYSTWQPNDPRPWGGRLGDDPYWAYAYAAVAQQSLGADQATRWSDTMNRHAARLRPEQIAAAQAWATAARSRIRFDTALSGPPDTDSFCRNVRRMGAF